MPSVSDITYPYIYALWGSADLADVSSWKVFFTCLLIFFGLATVSTIITHYRLKIPGAGALALQQIKWLREWTDPTMPYIPCL